MKLALLVPFLAAVLLIQLTPGPGMLFIVANGITGGARAGVAAAFGAAAGMVVHTVAAALGLAALFLHAPLVYDLVRVAGAGYLLWLAARTWRSAGLAVPAQPGTPAATATPARIFVRALVNNLANPKVILFFVSYLPQFVDHGRGHVTMQFLVLGGLFLLVGLVMVAGVAAHRSGDVDRPRPAEHPDHQVPQDRHDVGGGAGADLRGVLGVGRVADVVQRLDRPMPAQQVGQAGGAGQLEREAGDRIHRHRPPPPGLSALVQVTGLAGDLEDLGGVREPERLRRDHLEGAQLDAAVGVVAGAVAHGHVLPGDGRAAAQQRGLVALGHKQVVRLLAGDQELGGLRVGLQCVGGDHHAGQVKGRKQRGERGHLLRRAADLALGQHRAALVVHRRQQVHRATVTAGRAGAAQRLAVDSDGPPPAGRGIPTLLVGQPGADRAGQRVGVQARKRPADGGLGRDGEAAGGVVAGAERGADRLGRVGGPFGDRGDRPRPGKQRGRRHGQDGNQRVTPATGSSRVGHGGEVGQQVWGLGMVEVAGDRCG